MEQGTAQAQLDINTTTMSKQIDKFIKQDNSAAAFKNELAALQEKHYAEIIALKQKWADDHNPVQYGDIITDHNGTTIQVDSMPTFYTDTLGVPGMIYRGIKVKKDGTPCKKNEIEFIHQGNITKHIKKTK
jgi:isopentenyl phosphate kinase